jgi:hypothetical protein
MKINKNTPINTKINDITITHINKSTRLVTCKCKCGETFKTDIYYLKHKTKCNHKQPITKEPLYHRWRNILTRCYNKNSKDYKYYGQKGITLCKQWHNYNNFKTWALNNGYQPHLEIDRIDNTKIYKPSNCRWVNHKVNVQNRTPWGKYYIYKRNLLPICAISKQTKLTYTTIYFLIHKNNVKPNTNITKLIQKRLKEK